MIEQAISRRPPAQLAWDEIVSLRGRIQIALLAGLVGWLYWDQIRRMVVIWSGDVDWSHGFLILPFCVYLLHSRREELARVRIAPSYWGLALMVTGIVAYALCIRARIGYPQPLSMLPVIAGAVLLVGGWGLLRQTAFPIAFLALAMPPPVRLYREITQPLQQLAATAAEPLLRLLPGVQIERMGINMTAYGVDGHERATFTVAGACSGMNSLLAFTAIGLAMVYFTRRPLWHRIAMGVAVVPVALACNVVRVVTTGSLMIYDLRSWAEGTPHMVLGLLTFGLGMLLYSAVLWVLDHLFVEDTAARAG